MNIFYAYDPSQSSNNPNRQEDPRLFVEIITPTQIYHVEPPVHLEDVIRLFTKSGHAEPAVTQPTHRKFIVTEGRRLQQKTPTFNLSFGEEK